MRTDDEAVLKRALTRYTVVSQIESKVVQGNSIAKAISLVLAQRDQWEEGSVSRSSMFRWYRAWKTAGFKGLKDQSRKMKVDSRVLSNKFLLFLKDEKESDSKTTLVEIIRRAYEKGVLSEAESVDRSTVWRTAIRMNLPILRKNMNSNTSMLPFAKAHRMQMVLADGKHFRAGIERRKKVALFFIDDCSRYLLGGSVGFSESSSFFLKSLYQIISKHGKMTCLYIDHGPGFIADDTKAVCASLGITVIYGKVRYPPGRGKIERFNRTVLDQLLRNFDKNQQIDPASQALENRIAHYLSRKYNSTEHSSIKTTPYEKFSTDERALEFPYSDEELRRHFVLSEVKKVSSHNVVSVNDVSYQVPFGHSGTRINIYRNILDESVHFLHHEKIIELQPPDLIANGRSSHRRKTPSDKEPTPSLDAATMSFNRELSSITASDGGYQGDKD